MELINQTGLNNVDHILNKIASRRVHQAITNERTNDGWLSHVTVIDNFNVCVCVVDTTQHFYE